MSALIDVSTAEGVALIRMNRPDKKNALNQEMYGALAAAFDAASADNAVRAIVLSGAPGAFCAGNDIGDFARFARGEAGLEQTWSFFHALGRLTKPLIAAVDGLAIGIGTTLLFHCDLAFATPRSQFRTPFLDLGLVPEAASSLLAPRLMGPQRAFGLLVMGDSFDAAAAQAAGFVYRIVEEGELHGAAIEAARRLAAKPPEALAIARQLMRGDQKDIQNRIAEEVEAFLERLKSAEAQQAFAAFMTRSSGVRTG